MTSQFAVLSKIGKKSKNQNLLSGDLTAVVHLCAVAIYTLVLLCNCVAPDSLYCLPKQVLRSSYCRKFVKSCWQLHATKSKASHRVDLVLYAEGSDFRN